MTLQTATKIRLTRQEKGGREYSEVWELRQGEWHMVYDSEGSAEYEKISNSIFDQYVRCFDKSEEVQ